MMKARKARLSFNISLIAFLILGLLGCGGGNGIDPQLQVISGTVTLDGAPLDQGSIQFYSATPQANSMVSSTTIRMGQFHLEPKGGLPPGVYKAAINSVKSSPDPANATGDKMDSVGTAIELIPQKYNKDTELTCEIVPGKPTVVHFELDSAKAKSTRK